MKSLTPATKSTGRFAANMVRWRWPLAIVGVLILVAALPFSQRLQMDRTIDQMFAPNDPTLLAYNELRDAFGGNAAVMLVYRDDNLMTSAGFDRAKRLSQLVADVDGVRGVLSVAQLNELLGTIRPAGLLTGFSQDTPPLLREGDLIARAFERLFVGYTHSDAGDRSAIVTLLDPPDVEVGHRPLVQRLREIIANEMPEGTSDAVLVGEPVLLSEGFDLIERDGFQLAVWTIAILSPLVLVLLRGVRWVFLQAFVIAWAVTVTRAVLYLTGYRLSLVSSILTAICTVIAVTSVIHLGSMWLQRTRRGDESEQASSRSFAVVMPAIFWACATDAAGFLSLLGSAISPIRDFAIMMGIASVGVWISMMLMAPLAMTFMVSERRNSFQILNRIERWIREGSVRIALLMIRLRVWVMLIAVLLSAFTMVGLSRLRIETSFLKNFRDDSQIAREYRIVESALAGAGVWDVVLDAPETLTDAYLADVRQLENRLREIDINGEKLTKVLSMADADRIAAAIPFLRVVTPTVRLTGMRAAIPAFSDALLSNDESEGRKLRIMLRSREHLGAETKMSLIARVEDIVKETTTTRAWKSHFPDDAPPSAGRVTGYYVMIARLVSQIIGDQWRCLMWATLMVWLLLALATRSLRLATWALIPNLLPVLGVLGIIGWMDMEMNMGAAMIAAVSIGLSIDGSIHYLLGYQRKIRRGRSDRDSAIYAQRGVGLPVVLATLALVIGFLGLGKSEFIPTATFGVLTAAALLLGAIVNLTLLPVLVSLRGRGSVQR